MDKLLDTYKWLKGDPKFDGHLVGNQVDNEEAVSSFANTISKHTHVKAIKFEDCRLGENMRILTELFSSF